METSQSPTHALRFESADGVSVGLSPHTGQKFQIEPLGFAELVLAVTESAPTLPIVVANANASRESTGLEVDGPLTVRMNWGNNGRVLAYGLVPEGWLPLPWTHRGLALLDRNCLVELEKLRESDAPGGGSAVRFAEWLGLADETVSPILFALEGKHRRPPTDFEMRVELQRAAKALGRLLSGAKVATVDKAQRRALQSMLLEWAEQRGKSTRLLLRACPEVVNRPKPARREHRAAEILQMAREEGVPVGSLVVLALLSCVYDQPAGHRVHTPGRAVLKPGPNYTPDDAYNALMDLAFLELLLNAQALFPGQLPVLYTRDVGLASFWVALHPTAPVAALRPRGRARTTATFSFDRGLFPGVPADELLRLRDRIAT